jgi:biuret amidohydrolase
MTRCLPRSAMAENRPSFRSASCATPRRRTAPTSPTARPLSKLRRGNAALRIGDPGPMGRILISGEPGNDFVAALHPLPGEPVVEKPGKGAFFATGLDALLRARRSTHLAIAGVTTEVCVQTTMREANDRGYECLLVEDATESYFPEFKAATLAMIRAQGAIVGWTATVDEVLAALEEP